MKYPSVCLLVASLALPASAFLPPTAPVHATSSARQASLTSRAGAPLSMAAEGSTAAGAAVVVGYPGGVAELIARRLKETQPSSPVRLVIEKEGFEGSLSLPGIDVVSTDLKSLSSDVLAGAKAVFVSMDQGVEKELGADQGKYVVLPSILDKVPSAVPVVVAAYANDTAPGVAALPIKLFGGGVNPKEAVESARGVSSSRKAVVVQHGRLFGYMPGQEPLPFQTGPLQTPVLDEAFAKQNMLLALGSSLARNPAAATLRSALAECMIRVADRLDSVKDFSVVSLAGSRPSEGDWENQLAVIDIRGGVTVYEKALVDGAAKVDLPLLQDWLQEEFGPTLSTLAISRVLNAPKPARITNSKTGGDLVWQYVDKDLNLRETGRWCIQLGNNKEGAPTVRILRVDASGDMLTEPLPGEQEVVQRFSEQLNKLLYSKRLTKKRSSSV